MEIENNNITIYQSNDGKISFNVNVFEETVWITQKQMAELFGIESHTITYHLKVIFNSTELDKDSTTRKIRAVQVEGNRKVSRDIEYYNLDVIISVGYRVNSMRATQFRKWATQVLKQYLMNGYSINESRIKSIEEKIEKLSSDLKSELREDFRAEFKEINKSLLTIANRSIAIHNYNQISLTSSLLEDKIIELLNELLDQARKKDLLNKTQLEEIEEIKRIIKLSPKNQEKKIKIISFFSKLGDKNSKLYKTITGVGISVKIIKDLKIGLIFKMISAKVIKN